MCETLFSSASDELWKISDLHAIFMEDATTEGEFVIQLLLEGFTKKCFVGPTLAPVLAFADEVKMKESGKGFGEGFIEEDGVIGADISFEIHAVMDDLEVEVKGVDEFVDKDFHGLFPAKEDDQSVLLFVVVRGFQEGDPAIHFIGTQGDGPTPKRFLEGSWIVVDGLDAPFFVKEILQDEDRLEHGEGFPVDASRKTAGPTRPHVEDGLSKGITVENGEVFVNIRLDFGREKVDVDEGIALSTWRSDEVRHDVDVVLICKNRLHGSFEGLVETIKIGIF